METLTTFFVCLWHTLLRNDLARDKSYNKFLALEEQKQNRKLEKLRMQHVRSSLGHLNRRYGYSFQKSDTPREDWDFTGPIPMVIVLLNQIINGTRFIDNVSCLGSLFVFCKTNEQAKATAEYYLTVFYEDSVFLPCLIDWCKGIKLTIASRATEVEICALEVNVDIYAKPSRGPMEVLKTPYKTMQKIVDTGNPKECPELFSFCTNSLECHYTAKWYLRMYKDVPEEREVNPEDTLQKVLSNVSFIKGNGDKYDHYLADEVIEDVSSYVQEEINKRKLNSFRAGYCKLTTKEIMQQKRWSVNHRLNTSFGYVHKSISLSWNELANMLQKGHDYSLPKCMSTKRVIEEMCAELEDVIQYYKKLREVAEEHDSFLIGDQETLTLLWALETWLNHQPFSDASTEPCPEEVEAPALHYYKTL